jgi:hypothetical protein
MSIINIKTILIQKSSVQLISLKRKKFHISREEDLICYKIIGLKISTKLGNKIKTLTYIIIYDFFNLLKQSIKF